jgi:hypothetical protein
MKIRNEKGREGITFIAFSGPVQRRWSHLSLPTSTHFLFSPHHPQILLKALLNLPATDFTLLLYILPEKLQTDVRADRGGIS